MTRKAAGSTTGDKLATGKWNHSVAVSNLHKALRLADIEQAAYSAAWLGRYRAGIDAAWRRIMAFCAEDLCGEGIQVVSALHYAYSVSYELDNQFAAILYICRMVEHGSDPGFHREPGQLRRDADELKCAAIVWAQQGERPMDPLPEAFDVHAGGQGSQQDWWDTVNSYGPPSPWRADAMRIDDSKTAEKKRKAEVQPALI